MFFRSFVILTAFVMPLALQANSHDPDLVISYPIARQKKDALFHTMVRNTIPGKRAPDDYHITLGIVKNVKRKDRALLRNLLESVSNIHLRNATFTARTAKRYLVNRSPNRCPIVLTPKASETAKFRRLNADLYASLRNFNARTRSRYVFHPDVIPQRYEPHITLANTQYIQSHALDRDVLIRRLNARLVGRNLELLKPTLIHFAPRHAFHRRHHIRCYVPAPQYRRRILVPVPQYRRRVLLHPHGPYLRRHAPQHRVVFLRRYP